MRETLISLGAEIVSTQYKMALQPFVAYTLFIVYVVCVVAIAFYIRMTIKDFISSTFVKVRSVLGYIIIVLILLCGATVIANTIALVPTDEITGYVIKVGDQTDMSAISALFEVTDTSDYPLLTVKTT